MKKNILHLSIASTILFLLISATLTNKKGDLNNLAKNSVSGIVNPNLKEFITYQINNGITIQSVFADYVFSEFTTKSTATEDSVFLSKSSFEYFDTHVIQTFSSRKNNQWVDNTQLFIYRPADQLLYDSLIYKSYDSTQMNFQYSLKYENFFDANGNDILNVGSEYNKENNTWKEKVKTEKAFLANNLVYREIEHYWNDDNQEWDKGFKTSYAYENNELIYVYNDLYNRAGNHWEPYRKTAHDRNESRNFYSVTDSIYDFWTFGFIPTALSVFAGNGNTIDTAIYFSWNNTNKDWESNELDIYHYKTNGEVSSIDFYGNPDNIEKSNNANNLSFQKAQSIVYYYKNDITNATQIETSLFSVFPNPVTNEVQLQVSNPIKCMLKVFNIQGQQILTKQINSVVTKINIRDFEKGMYLFQIENNGEQSTRKIVKY